MPRVNTHCCKSFTSICRESSQQKKIILHLQQENAFLREKITKHGFKPVNEPLGDEITLRECVALSFASSSVKQTEISSQHLVVDSFQAYFENYVKSNPFISFMMQILINKHQERKLKTHSTHSQWFAWFFLYKSFLADMLLKAKQGKIILRTNLLISLLLLYTKALKPL